MRDRPWWTEEDSEDTSLEVRLSCSDDGVRKVVSQQKPTRSYTENVDLVKGRGGVFDEKAEVDRPESLMRFRLRQRVQPSSSSLPSPPPSHTAPVTLTTLRRAVLVIASSSVYSILLRLLHGGRDGKGHFSQTMPALHPSGRPSPKPTWTAFETYSRNQRRCLQSSKCLFRLLRPQTESTAVSAAASTFVLSSLRLISV